MKSFVLTLLLFGFITTTQAQKMRTEILGNNRNETYSFFRGGDSLQYTIAGKDDTLKKTKFYRNGNIERITWKNDSIYSFDALGRIVVKRPASFDDYRYKEGYTTYFYNNGSIKVSSLATKDYYLEQKFLKMVVCFSEKNT